MNWKEQLGNIKQEGDRQDDRVDFARKKKLSRLMYIRRKLDKDIRKLLKQDVIKFKQIEEIHGRHNVRVLSGPDRITN